MVEWRHRLIGEFTSDPKWRDLMQSSPNHFSDHPMFSILQQNTSLLGSRPFTEVLFARTIDFLLAWLSHSLRYLSR